MLAHFLHRIHGRPHGLSADSTGRNRVTNPMIQLKLAGLTTCVRLAHDVSAGGPSAALILLHGHGVAGDDLVFLSSELQLPPHIALVFPEGPLIVDEVGAGEAKRGWWPADSTQMRIAMFTGQAQRAARVASSGCEGARAQFVSFLDALQTELGLYPEQIVLGGFSQGAILSLDSVLHDDRPWAGLLCLSGTLCNLPTLRARLRRRPGVPVIISHGMSDPILPFAAARRLYEEFSQAGWNASFVPFEGSHGIPKTVVSVLSNTVRGWLGQSPTMQREANARRAREAAENGILSPPCAGQIDGSVGHQ